MDFNGIDFAGDFLYNTDSSYLTVAGARSNANEMNLQDYLTFGLLSCVMMAMASGCRSAADYRAQADNAAAQIIDQKMQQALGQVGQFGIERPSNTLRRRLLVGQKLPYAAESSLGIDALSPVEHWPEKDYPKSESSLDPVVILEDAGGPLRLSLADALQVGARNSFEYQTLKEDIFQAALDLDLERNEFRTIFVGQVESLASTDRTAEQPVTGTENSASAGANQLLKSGAELGGALAVDLANLLTMGGASSLGITADATVTIPLLRGSGKHIITEPLTQAERNVVYSIYTFERFKRTFAVDVAGEYLGVLQQLDEVKNSMENYRGLIASARRARRRADAGRLTEIQVDQAVQNELRARNRWIRATEAYKSRLDSFKNMLGLPPDSKVELDSDELKRLSTQVHELLVQIVDDAPSTSKGHSPEADVVVVPPSRENGGPLEMDETLAIQSALENRLDLRIAQGQVYDAQRQVVVKADALGAELTLFGSTDLGASRSITSASSPDARLRTDRGIYRALLNMDLPFERTAERNAYRNSFILLERAVRQVQILEDRIKLSIRGSLRDLLEARESLQIQAKSVDLAKKRVKSADMFLDAGRAQIRDLLEAQESLLSAQNSLTAAVVSYRIAELQVQSDMGLLKVDEKGLWEEFNPDDINNAK